jgi:hypothetical protein
MNCNVVKQWSSTCDTPTPEIYKNILRGKTPWPESASELYRPSNRRLSEKLVSTFEDRGYHANQRDGSPTAVFSVF